MSKTNQNPEVIEVGEAKPGCAPVSCYAAIVADLEIIMQKLNTLRQNLKAPEDNEIEDELWLASMKIDRAVTVAKRVQRSRMAAKG